MRTHFKIFLILTNFAANVSYHPMLEQNGVPNKILEFLKNCDSRPTYLIVAGVKCLSNFMLRPDILEQEIISKFIPCLHELLKQYGDFENELISDSFVHEVFIGFANVAGNSKCLCEVFKGPIVEAPYTLSQLKLYRSLFALKQESAEKYKLKTVEHPKFQSFLREAISGKLLVPKSK